MRRLINLVLLGFAFYGGLWVERGLNDARCSNAGGEMSTQRVCTGVSQ